MGRPSILVDHEYSSGIGATLMASDHWRCVWFDAIAAVFVHDSLRDDCPEGCRRFRRPAFPSRSFGRVAGGLRAGSLGQGIPKLRPGPRQGTGRSCPAAGMAGAGGRPSHPGKGIPIRSIGWKFRGQIELNRELVRAPARDFAPLTTPFMICRWPARPMPSGVPWNWDPDDFMTLLDLKRAYDVRLMNEAALPLSDRLVALYPKNPASGPRPGHRPVRAEEVRPRSWARLPPRPGRTSMSSTRS